MLFRSRIGEKVENRPPKKQRMGTETETVQKMPGETFGLTRTICNNFEQQRLLTSEKPKPAETVTSGAVHSGSATIERTVYMVNTPDVPADAPKLMHFGISGETGGWRVAVPDEGEILEKIYVVGFSHALNFSNVLPACVRVATEPIFLQGWNEIGRAHV